LLIRQGRDVFPGRGDKVKSTRNSLALMFCFLLLGQFASPEEKRPSKPRFSLKLTGGWGSRVPIGDVNDYLESLNKVYETSRTADSDRVLGKIQKLDTNIAHWEAELRFDLTPRLAFGIATSLPFHKHNESPLTFIYTEYDGPYIKTWTVRPEIKVFYPIRLSIYYTLAFIRRLNISIGGGIGFYSARITLSYRDATVYPFEDVSWIEGSQVAKKNFGLGFHGNINLEYNLSDKVILITEFQPRYVRISGFKGTLTATTSEGESHQVRGTLYYFTYRGVGGRSPALMISEEPPQSPIDGYENVRKAVLDLSGFSLRIGLRIRLF
jgi:hypothetical protein